MKSCYINNWRLIKNKASLNQRQYYINQDENSSRVFEQNLI